MTIDNTEFSTPRYLLKVFLVSLAAALFLGLVDTTQFYAFQIPQKKPVTWSDLASYKMPFWFTATVLVPWVALLARRLGFAPGRRIRVIAIHIVLSLVYTYLHTGLTQAHRLLSNGISLFSPKFIYTVQDLLIKVAELDIALYAVIVGLVLLVETNRRYRDEERMTARLALEKAQLEASLSGAQLDALRKQLQPHFLFNALHAVSTLIMRGDNQAAHRMLLHLSDFLRMTLDSDDAPEVTLAQELEFLDAYLQIQRERFGDRLQVVLDVAEETQAAILPNLVLQPLVENSIRHGFTGNISEGLITVKARRAQDRLLIDVVDDGVGLGAHKPVEGVGLGNIRARLEHLYPNTHALELAPAKPTGTQARLTLPWQTTGATLQNPDP